MKEFSKEEKEDIYAQAIESLNIGLSISRIGDGKILYVNPGLEKLFGYNKGELLQKHISSLFNEEDIASNGSSYNISELIKHKKSWSGETKNIKKDNELFWCQTEVSTINHHEYGEVVIISYTEITNKIKTINELKQAQKLLKSSLESTNGFIFISIDNHYKYLNFNQFHKDTMKQIYGVDVKVGMNLLECINVKTDREIAKHCYDIALSGNTHTKINEYGSDPNRLYFETNYNPIYNDKNEVIGASAYASEITKRVQLENALKNSEERFKQLSELTFEGIIIHSNGICIDINKAVEDTLGFKKEELIGKNLIKKIIPKEHQETVYKNMRNNISEPYEILAKRKDGSLTHIEIGGKKEIIYKGEKAMVTTARDISENRKNKIKLKKSEADLLALLENTSETIWSVDEQYRITVSNSNFTKNIKNVFNYELKKGDIILNILPDPLNKIWKERYDRTLNGEHFIIIDEFNFEIEKQYTETSFNPVVIDNKIVGAACITRDITSQKSIENELKLSKEKFQMITDLSPAAISIQSKEKYLYVNTAWHKLTGYSEKEALKMSPLKMIHPDMLNTIEERMNSRLDGGEAPSRYDLKIITKSNETKWIDISLMVLNYEGQTASLSVSFDITELKKAKETLQISENKLKIANSTKNKFFSIIGHDLRGPISSISSLSNELHKEYNNIGEKEKKEYLKILSTTAGKSFMLLNDLLSWARSQQGEVKINKALLNLRGIIKESIEPNLLNANLKEIKVKNKVPHELLAMVDEHTIMTVIGNLFNNAVKYTHIKGVIEINANENKKEIVVSISDSGIGMSKAIMDKLFQLDESFSTAGTNNEQGTGLGLLLCKDFIELNGGKLSVKSKEGKGSTFSFTIPKP